ncbi:MAG: twin-arginine translocase subunit TatC [Archaeoglobaceae archaeon]
MSTSYFVEDKEQSLLEHLAELRSRVRRVFILLLVFMPVVFIFSPKIIKLLWSELVGEEMFAFSVTEWIFLNLSLSLVFTLILIYPYLMLELYLFAKPGLYENERKFLKTVLIPSYVLFLFGIIFAFKFLVPFLYRFSYGEEFFSVGRTLGNAVNIAFFFAISLQIPLAVYLLDRFKIVDYDTMKKLRLPIYLLIVMLILNSPTNLSGISQILVLILFGAMFELGLLLVGMSKRYKHSKKVKSNANSDRRSGRSWL